MGRFRSLGLPGEIPARVRGLRGPDLTEPPPWEKEARTPARAAAVGDAGNRASRRLRRRLATSRPRFRVFAPRAMTQRRRDARESVAWLASRARVAAAVPPDRM